MVNLLRSNLPLLLLLLLHDLSSPPHMATVGTLKLQCCNGSCCSTQFVKCGTQDCQLSVYKPNPRQYVATISQVRRTGHKMACIVFCQADSTNCAVFQWVTVGFAEHWQELC